ncbi:uncharacterized protein LOC110448677 [Mizuhopecten yessoensis]|uniref:uncharacterized protein LOC110448677 n=1 Tax=Mizuhopecten yessoensis TaxID=6573 RepID=UPI000B457F50|nr:uncharacterized protein LOC110448677 [Mizuhopecten yessoensis]
MYNNIKSCVQFNSKTSDFFPCLIGVRQGENLSPFLFSVFLNDIESYFASLSCVPLENVRDKLYNELHIFVEIFVLLYADDSVLFSESPEGLQSALNVFQQYCKIWKLNINVNKTKVMVFRKRKSKQQHVFVLQNEILEIVDNFTYLGITFNYNGSFVNARRRLINQAQKSIFAIYKKIRNLSLPIDLQLKLFDSLVEPILLYGSDVWGFENLKIIEQIHLKFCKRILKVRSTTPNFMIYGELGRVPLEINVKLRMLGFWNRIISNENKLSSILLRLALHMQNDDTLQFKWINYIKGIFNETGF